MMRSMTAFGRSSGSKKNRWQVEIRSVNHRFFEFSAKVPSMLNSLENKIKEAVQAKIPRGKVTVLVTSDTEQFRYNGLAINDQAIEFYIYNAKKLRKRFGLKDELSVSDLIKLPGVFATGKSEEDSEKSWPEIKKVLDHAIKLTIHSKEIEGGKLAVDIFQRLQQVSKAVKKIKAQAEGQTERIFKKLKERVDQLISEKSSDQERFHREVAFLADRSDITEELVRMSSHLDLFQKKIKQETEVGRELDFLCQEMNREVNTMASKAQLFEISTEVVFIKGELEKIREQIQNIE